MRADKPFKPRKAASKRTRKKKTPASLFPDFVEDANCTPNKPTPGAVEVDVTGLVDAYLESQKEGEAHA